MPSSNPNQAALRSFLDSQLGFLTEFTRTGCDSARKLNALNLQIAQQLADTQVTVLRQLLACTNPLQLSGAAVSQLAPLVRHLGIYQQQLMAVMAGVQVDLTRSADGYLPQAGRSAAAIAEDLARRGSELGAAYAHTFQGEGAAVPAGANGIHHTPG